MRIQKAINNCPVRATGGISPHEALFGAPDPNPVMPKWGSSWAGAVADAGGDDDRWAS